VVSHADRNLTPDDISELEDLLGDRSIIPSLRWPVRLNGASLSGAVAILSNGTESTPSPALRLW